MIIDKILEASKPYLEDRTIKDLVIGLSLIGIELDNGDIAVSYTLRDSLPSGCSAFSFAQDLIGKSAIEVANLAKEGSDNIQRAIGIATLTAGSCQQNLLDAESFKSSFGVEILPTDTIGMIGHIAPIVDAFSKNSKRLIIFDMAASEAGEKLDYLYPMKDQAKLLPECDIVILSGTTMINQSLEGLLEMCPKAREVIMIGTSTPMFPQAFENTKVSVLAGSWWNKDNKEELFKTISTAGGISHIRKSMIKKSVHVNK